MTILREKTVRFVQEPRRLDQIGRPDFVAMDGLLPIGYIEAEAYGRDLNNLTGHAQEQNARFIENLDNFILTNFVDFQLWTEGRLRAAASIADGTGEFETLLERFLNAEPIQIATPEALAGYLARRTRELQTQVATVLTDEGSDIYRMFSAFKELLLSTLTPDDFCGYVCTDACVWVICGALHTPECDELLATHGFGGTSEVKPVPHPTLSSHRLTELGGERYLYSGRDCGAAPKRSSGTAPHGVCGSESI